MAQDFYKQGGSYFLSGSNQKILNLTQLKGYSEAGGKEIQPPTISPTTKPTSNQPTITGYDQSGKEVQVPRGTYVKGISLTPPKKFDAGKTDLTKQNETLNQYKAKNEELIKQQTQAETTAKSDEYSKSLTDLVSTIKSTLPVYSPETATKNKQALLNKQAEIRNLNLSAQTGVDLTGQKIIPMEEITGQQLAIQQEAQRAGTLLSNEEANLISQVELDAQDRKDLISGATTIANLQDKIQSHIDTAKQSVLDQAKQLTTDAQANLATALDQLKGTTWKQLTPEQQNSLYSLAQQGGYPVSVLQAGMDAVASQISLDNNLALSKSGISQTEKAKMINDLVANQGYSVEDATSKVNQIIGQAGYGKTPIATDNIDAFKSAITTQESGDYSAVNKDSGALGAYQMMPTTGLPLVGLDPNNKSDIQKFLSTPSLQDTAFNKFISGLSDKYGNDTTKMAAHYYGGAGGAAVVGTPAGDRYGKYDKNGKLTGYPSVNEYVNSIRNKMNKFTGEEAVANEASSLAELVRTNKLTEKEAIDQVSGANKTKLINELTKVKAEKTVSSYTEEMKNRILKSVDELLKQVSPWTVGWGSTISGIPTTKAKSFSAQLDTLKASIAFSELTAMREASKTGGALGQVSDREGQLLSSALGALDQGQSAEDFKVQLNKIKTSIENWKKELNNYAEESGISNVDISDLDFSIK